MGIEIQVKKDEFEIKYSEFWQKEQLLLKI
jgi:hypothetical protein